MKNIIFIFALSMILCVSISNICKAQGEEYLAFAEVMPTPIGGAEAIYKKVVYPTIALKAGIEGKVYVLIYINEHGTVEDVKAIKSPGAGLDDAAIEALKKTKFTPGKNGGANVKVKLSMAINFKLR